MRDERLIGHFPFPPLLCVPPFSCHQTQTTCVIALFASSKGIGSQLPDSSGGAIWRAASTPYSTNDIRCSTDMHFTSRNGEGYSHNTSTFVPGAYLSPRLSPVIVCSSDFMLGHGFTDEIRRKFIDMSASTMPLLISNEIQALQLHFPPKFVTHSGAASVFHS